MGLIDTIKNKFMNKENDSNEEKQQEEYEVLINDIDTFALYFKDREIKYVLFKDKNFPFMLNDPDIEFIEMNRDNFDYYGEFHSFELMAEKLLKLEKEDAIRKKTEDDYLKDYLEHSENEYSKIIEKMKTFEIDRKQYNELIKEIKKNIQTSIEQCYRNHKNSNPHLETNRTYKEIMDNLISIEEFFSKYPYEYYGKFKYQEGCQSHCGYPDYMWQSGAERNIYIFI